MSKSLGTAARRVALVALASACGAAAAQAQEFTMGYSVGFLTDPFQAIQVDLTMASAEEAGLKTCPWRTPMAMPASRSPTSTT